MTKNGYVFHAERLTGGASSNLDDGYQKLIAAIIRQAVKDYVSVLLRLFSKPDGAKRTALEMQKTELEVFFHSEWYASITDLDGDRLISAARRQAVEKAKEAIRRKHRKSWLQWRRPVRQRCAADSIFAPQEGAGKGER